MMQGCIFTGDPAFEVAGQSVNPAGTEYLTCKAVPSRFFVSASRNAGSRPRDADKLATKSPGQCARMLYDGPSEGNVQSMVRLKRPARCSLTGETGKYRNTVALPGRKILEAEKAGCNKDIPSIWTGKLAWNDSENVRPIRLAKIAGTML